VYSLFDVLLLLLLLLWLLQQQLFTYHTPGCEHSRLLVKTFTELLDPGSNTHN